MGVNRVWGKEPGLRVVSCSVSLLCCFPVPGLQVSMTGLATLTPPSAPYELSYKQFTFCCTIDQRLIFLFSTFLIMLFIDISLSTRDTGEGTWELLREDVASIQWKLRQ